VRTRRRVRSELDAYRQDPAHLSAVVRFDLPRLGEVAGLDAVHLQCHIGTDTISLAKLGASVTGLDFSPSALAQARGLAARAGVDVRFVESELYSAPAALGTTYDLVYTGVGALNWLPDIAGWAKVVAAVLRPGGRLHLREGHPMLWSLADKRPDGLLSVEYPTSRSPSRSCPTSPARTWRPTTSSCTTGRTSGTTAWADRHRCWTPGSR
jgi:SAM-dependent methyltransferase